MVSKGKAGAVLDTAEKMFNVSKLVEEDLPEVSCVLLEVSMNIIDMMGDVEVTDDPVEPKFDVETELTIEALASMFKGDQEDEDDDA